MRWVSWASVVLAFGCGKVSIDAEGKACPCPRERGLVCDPTCRVCVPQGTKPGSTCAGTGDSGNCVPKITFSNFRPAWVTPNSIYWTWTPDSEDKQSEFQSYRLELTQKLPAGAPRTYDASTNPELGLYLLPNDGADLTESTLITDLEPEVQYAGRLVVSDLSGCEYSEESDAPITYAKNTAAEVEIFGESGFSGDTLGGSITNSGCHQGTSCFQMASCQLPDASVTKCCDNLRVHGLSILSNISEGQFAQAYVEFYARNDSTAPAYFSGLWLRVGDPGAGDNAYGLHGWTFPATGAYRRLQFPLRELTLGEDGPTKLTWDKFASSDIREFNWYTCLTDGATAWFDEVYIRW